MNPEFGLTHGPCNTKYAPLAALGHHFRQSGTLQPLQAVCSGPGHPTVCTADKLIQVLVSILAGCEYICEVNAHLRTEVSLAHAWGFEGYLEQSTLARMLNELSRTQLAQIQQAVATIWAAHSRALRHDWRGFLRLEVDLSGLPCGKGAQASEKGYFSGTKDATGRQLARASSPQYHETIWSELFPGSVPSSVCLKPAVLAVEIAFDLAPPAGAPPAVFDLAAARRARTLWRIDGGFGTDPNLRWLLGRNYQLIAKGFAGRRAQHLAAQVQRWIPYGDAWLGAVATPQDYGRRLHMWVKRRLDQTQFRYSYYLTTLQLHSLSLAMQLYDQRGGTEVEQFRNDKQGLHLSMRRKQRFVAQKGLVLLTDLAHNLLADFQQTALVDSPFCGYAAKRMVRDLLAIEGNLVWEQGELKRIELHQDHPKAKALLPCLVKYCHKG